VRLFHSRASWRIREPAFDFFVTEAGPPSPLRLTLASHRKWVTAGSTKRQAPNPSNPNSNQSGMKHETAKHRQPTQGSILATLPVDPFTALHQYQMN
jgi:hypothetical protein